jgi:hypothetical protein
VSAGAVSRGGRRVAGGAGLSVMDPPHLRWREQAAPGPDLILVRAADLVTFGWCREAEARDAHDAPAEPWSAHAVRWSLLGALVAAVDLPPEPQPAFLGPLRRALSALAEVIEEPSLSKWNDAPGRTQEDVVRILEAARRVCADWDHGPET